jgi:nucleotide-binding universal stress UspA family protein
VSKEQIRPQRILVALDGSRESLAALNAAVTLAQELKADLIGLFVEDVNLVRLSQMPFAREVHLTTARFHALNDEKMSQAIRLQAARARRALQKATQRAGIHGQFKITRGLVPASVVAAALNADILVLGRISRPLHHRMRLGSTARAALAQAGHSILLMRRQQSLEHSVLVTFDDSELSWRALRKAAALSDPHYPLTLLLLTASQTEAELWQTQIEAWLQARNQQAIFRQMPFTTMPRLLQAVQAENCDLLIIGSEQMPDAVETAVALLDELDCSLMLVR